MRETTVESHPSKNEGWGARQRCVTTARLHGENSLTRLHILECLHKTLAEKFARARCWRNMRKPEGLTAKRGGECLSIRSRRRTLKVVRYGSSLLIPTESECFAKI
jgi:hypothetical protein